MEKSADIVYRMTKLYCKLSGDKKYENNVKKVAKSSMKSHKYKLPKLFEKALSTENNYSGIDKVYILKSKRKSNKKVLFIHGGAFVFQPLIMHWIFALRLRHNLKCDVVMPIYPKAPKHKAKESFDYFTKIYKTMLNESKSITIVGDSAGGNIGLALALHLKNQKISLPKGLVLISPSLDIALSGAEIKKIEKLDPIFNLKGIRYTLDTYRGELSPDDWRISPIFGEFEGLCPITTFVGTREIMLPDCKKLHLKLDEEGIDNQLFVGKDEIHDYMLMYTKKAVEHYKKLLIFINRL